MARAAAPAESGVAPGRPVEQTSLAARNTAPDEVTVRFTRWTPFNNTAYQRGQFAGFRAAVARRLVVEGAAVVVQK
jgi:hypothetical protein